MFESDDFDQVLSQFDFSDDITNASSKDKHGDHKLEHSNKSLEDRQDIVPTNSDINLVVTDCSKTLENEETQTKVHKHANIVNTNNLLSPKHMKRKMIHSYFDHKSKRKFPGPAGLLTGGFEENKDENICQMELLSQDVDFTQNNLRGDLFESPLWTRLLDDLKDWNIKNVDSIKNIKQEAITGSLRRRKAHTITAFVEAVDRSVTDPLIMMRDTTGNIKGTLHRDAWTAFSPYIASEYCALILSRPTILTTGVAFKKHYLNITLSNILAVYSSAVLNEEVENKPLPDGYLVVYEDDYTVIKTQNNVQNIGINGEINGELNNDSSNMLDDLDSIFSDDIF